MNVHYPCFWTLVCKNWHACCLKNSQTPTDALYFSRFLGARRAALIFKTGVNNGWNAYLCVECCCSRCYISKASASRRGAYALMWPEVAMNCTKKNCLKCWENSKDVENQHSNTLFVTASSDFFSFKSEFMRNRRWQTCVVTIRQFCWRNLGIQQFFVSCSSGVFRKLKYICSNT